jgi:partner of Y14 and mago protein
MAGGPSSNSKDSDNATKSGITTNDEGIRHIPASVRADGSVRKEIKIRPGYRPPEDVEVYKNRTAEAFRNRGKGGGVPGAEGLKPEVLADSSAASNKNAKRREARKRAAAAKGEGDEDSSKVGSEQQDKAEEIEIKDPEAEKEKEAKKLLKKLRQARDLKDKKEQGAALLPEQFEKVIRINELIRQLDNLGFDADGEKKP